jgi:hypothetical protein
MSQDARRLTAVVDGPQSEERSNPAFRKDFVSQTKALFESFGTPLAGMSDAPFADLLRSMASFPTYSLGNQALIALQGGAAQAVTSAERWTGLGRHLVTNARAIYIWAPIDTRGASQQNEGGYARPSIVRAEQIATSLGLREVNGQLQFDASAVTQNALWGVSQTWRSVRTVQLTEGDDHIAVKLLMNDGRVLDRRARTMISLVKSLMQAGTSPNDETIASYLAQEAVAGQPAKSRNFFQKFKLVPVYDISETDGPEFGDPPALDFTAAVRNLSDYVAARKAEVIVGDHPFKTVVAGERREFYINNSCEHRTQLAYLLDAAAELLSHQLAIEQGRELLIAECMAVKFVLDTHFGFKSINPELGPGLAPNVEPHAAADVVKARLITIHDVAKSIVLAARPAYENPLLKVLSDARVPTPLPTASPSDVQAPATEAAPTLAVVKKLEAPKPRLKKPLIAEAAALTAPIAASNACAAPEEFNPFAAETVVNEDAADFNPFA